MPKIGDTVVYGTSGVCRITDRRYETFGGVSREYFILSPVGSGKCTIFLPLDNPALLAALHPLLSPAEWRGLAATLPPLSGGEWPCDSRQRNKRCKELLASGDRDTLIRLVKTVYGEKEYVPGVSARLPCDEVSARRAADMLYEELSLVFKISREQVVPFLLGQAEATEPLTQ